MQPLRNDGGVRRVVERIESFFQLQNGSHSYRMWIDAIGTPIGVQQKLMRHSDIRTTMNIYGDAATEDMREAHGKIVRLALQTV